ncbi:MAG: hypothetical protein HZB87_09865, partial [Desulfatitalea sp.]|nr:hypothetical protein [Desulfatitalea sp.]
QETYYWPFLAHFREQPFYDSPDLTVWLRGLLDSEDFKQIFDLDEK